MPLIWLWYISYILNSIIIKCIDKIYKLFDCSNCNISYIINALMFDWYYQWHLTLRLWWHSKFFKDGTLPTVRMNTWNLLYGYKNLIISIEISYNHTIYEEFYIIGPWISSRCFFKDGSSSTSCMKFRMLTHIQGSTVSNFKFQCMTVHFSVN